MDPKGLKKRWKELDIREKIELHYSNLETREDLLCVIQWKATS